MAIREKTVMFAVPTASALVADKTVTNLDQITLYIPEASPTFKSVFVEVGFQDVITATGGTVNEHRVGLRLGANAYTTFTETDDITHSGENMAGIIGPIDFTSHFAANWTGTSMTCDLQVYFDQSTGTTLGMANVTAVIYVTYEYNDTAASQLKTVRIPLESLVGPLPTAATNFGTSQIPQLTGVGGLLPEGSPVVRDWFLLIEGNESMANAVTDWTLSANIDGGATTAFTTQEGALASDRFCRWTYKPAVPTTTAAHNLQLWGSIARANNLTVTLIVTYQFTRSTTTRVLNSILVPIEIASPLGGPTAGEASRFERYVTVMEPGTISLKQSAVRLNYNTAATPGTISVMAGAQAARVYTPSSSVACGMYCLQHRVDAGGAQGAGITLARGRNQLVLDVFASSAVSDATNISGYLLLNYESDLSAAGVGAHAHTVFRNLLSWDALLTDRNVVTGYSFPIPEANYWLVAMGFCFTQWIATASNAVTFDVQALPGEGKGGGYYDIYADAYQSDAERSCSIIWMRGRDAFKRCPQDADSERLDIETARNYRLFTTTTCGNGIFAAATYHSMTWTAAGNLQDADLAKATTLKLVHKDTGEVRQTQVLPAGTTAFSFTVYDNTDDYCIDAYQDGTHAGRSDYAKAA